VLSGVLFANSCFDEAFYDQDLFSNTIHHSMGKLQSGVRKNIIKKKKRDNKFTNDYNDFNNNPNTSKNQKKRLRPYLLPINSPIKSALDEIFTTQRATANQFTFANAGFTTIATQPRSFIVVGKHPALPNQLVKAYLDDEMRQKEGYPGWIWLANRCKGARKIEKVLKKHRFTKFTVAKKWIYPLPLKPAPSRGGAKRRYNEVLVVTDMKLASKEESLNAWKNMTKEDLDALYIIICSAGGSSYREDNIPYTQDGTFAFIDTEYPDRSPDFKSILPYLSSEMQTYWRKLVRKGGNH